MASGALLPFWHALGRQLENPHGFFGRLVGRLMGIANRQPTAFAIDALDVRPGDCVMDMGFGPGHAVARIARDTQCALVCGIDQSATMVAQARRRNRAGIRAGRVDLRQGDFSRLPFPDRSVDRIMASNVIYFWRDIPAVLGEMRRVLRPGGRIVIYATEEATMRNWSFAGTGTHRLFTRKSLTDALQASFRQEAIAVQEVALPGNMRGLLAIIDDEPCCQGSEKD